MIDINPQFLDVDFSRDPLFQGGFNGMGDSTGQLSYADAGLPIIPEGQWDAYMDRQQAEKSSADYLVTRIYNQMQEGSCVANATSQSHEVCQAKQFGKDKVVHLSAISLYKRIGSSPGSGAMCVDGINEMKKDGILPLDNEDNRAKYGGAVMPNTGFYGKYPDNWKETAKRFRALETYTIRGLNELVTCLLLNMPVVVGRQGHSICYLRAFKKSGSLFVLYVNSWGDWGQAGGTFDKGFGVDSIGTVRQSAQEAFAVRSCVQGYL